jgi:dipeptidyl aminopeptidase/acylaminoacyl peptidase
VTLRALPRAAAALGLALLPAFPQPVAAQSDRGVREPLSLEAASAVQRLSARVPLHFSPDGGWVAHTVATHERVARDPATQAFTATGVALTEGDARMEATIVHTRSGETVRLGGSASSSWSPVWSPDGERVAFYSDEAGEAGLWVWERETGERRRVSEATVRPFFGFEGPRWSLDGERLVVQVVPEGMSVADANARDPFGSGNGSSRSDASSVVVRRAGFGPADGAEGAGPASGGLPSGFLDFRAVDLAVIDVATGEEVRIARGSAVGFHRWSPDGRSVAYTAMTGMVPNSQQAVYDLVLHDLESSSSRTLVRELRLAYGIEWEWSPDGSHLAYVSSGSMGSGEIVLVSPADGTETILGDDDTPSFDRGAGEVPPLWSADGSQVFAVGDGEVWRLEVATGKAERVAEIPGWRVVMIASAPDRSTVHSTDRGRTLWVLARSGDGRSAIHAVDLETGATRLALEESKSYRWPAFSFTGSDATGELAFISTDLQTLDDVWLLDPGTGALRRATTLNEGFDGIELGSSRLIEWTGPEGQVLRGALLLPPGHVPGERLPMVVSVYGGVLGSNSLNQFGLRFGESPVFNWHVLATRGFAVLVPDAPLREGRIAEDIVATVVPGVDAAIEQGYADPDRIAVMGQSFGAFNTLSLITRTTRFRAAVITAAVTHPDLFADYLRNVGYHEQGQGRMGGTIWEHPERYRENSPLFEFDRIETPLLIGQGDRDRDLYAADAIFAALQRLDRPVEYRVYPGEGHVISRPSFVIDFWERRLEFLAEHLDLVLGPDGSVLSSDRAGATDNEGRRSGPTPAATPD